ncbi:tRNA (adenosine(37)-N6)-threonylcarbamoyltransferase complex dimerization subunit type 1 TsaB [Granulicoccus phenolivorans]|uniref:tRNA (adenosine(37)-N6)-threonylcarbamoyltransferase complex dimerization subunit type 1 TsaB n=1 Tax=Granulicoccus phenolivorans TaxID=266854 RepID=UPI00040A8BCF|nr:tRNA (adenosine(37)-N6)-threonylcarbamoyltransferase complex dimerization subunit type 1 TsaB [Granulicoccus phenolivorans]
MTVLAIDTSTDVRVAVADGPTVLARATEHDTRSHVEQLVPLIRRALEQAALDLARIDLIVVGMGPGPFTGLRVGIATAQALAIADAIPLRRVCSLDVLALTGVRTLSPADRAEGFLTCTDARRKEVYWARYDAAGVRDGEPRVGPPDALPDLPIIGPGVAAYPQLGNRGTVEAVDAGLLATRGTELPEVGASPLYLRRPDAAVPTRRKSALALPQRPGAARPRIRRRPA